MGNPILWTKIIFCVPKIASYNSRRDLNAYGLINFQSKNFTKEKKLSHQVWENFKILPYQNLESEMSLKQGEHNNISEFQTKQLET